METNRNEGKDFGDGAVHRITCPACKGEGKIKCGECNGKGVGEKCSICNGTGRIKCPSCGGVGVDYDQEPPAKCTSCDGTGKVICSHCSGRGVDPCSECNGMGATPCEHCQGSGGYSVREFDEYCLSHIRLDGSPDHVLTDFDVGWEFWAEAAKTGSGGAAYVNGYLAACETQADTLEDLEDEYLTDFRDSAKAGFFWGNCGMGLALWSEGYYPQAIEAFQKAVRQGNVLAAGYLAVAYYLGKYGVAKDEGKAVEFSRMLKGSPYEKCEVDEVSGLPTFMKYLASAVSGDANALAWVAMSVYPSFVNESECLEILEAAAAKGANNIKVVFEKFCSCICSEKFKKIKDMFDQERKRKALEKKAESKPASQPVKSDSRKALPNKAESKPAPQPAKADSRKALSNKGTGRSAKKRWCFILLGLIFGWFGAHYMYAKRWLMLLLTIGSFTTGVVMMGKSETNQKEVPVQAVQHAEGDAPKGDSEAIGAICLVLWLVMWLGGALFVKKDGKGDRM